MNDKNTVKKTLFAPEKNITRREATERCSISSTSVGFRATGHAAHNLETEGNRVNERPKAKNSETQGR